MSNATARIIFANMPAGAAQKFFRAQQNRTGVPIVPFVTAEAVMRVAAKAPSDGDSAPYPQ